MSANSDEPEVLFHWSARKVQPIVILYVAVVFIGFIAVSYFVLHSTTAVKALAMAAVGAIVPLVPAVMGRTEFRLDTQVLERRPKRDENPKDFETVFELGELSHIAPIRQGFKFYKPLDEAGPLRRFWKLHLSDEFSGEVQVESADREKVFGALSGLGVPER
jgi:hypothetical protein